MRLIFLILIFFTQNILAAEYGIFMVVRGHVFIEKENGSNRLEAKINSKIQVGETVITDADSKAKIVMSDRNILNILPNTKLKIEKYTNSENDKNVSLKLIEGKLRTKVEQKYNTKTSKFEIRTATAVAGVRGTEFITSFDIKTQVTEVLTFKGQVMFRSMTSTDAGAKGNSEVIVAAGERSQVKDGKPASEPIKITGKELIQIDEESNTKDKNKNKDADKKKQSKDERNGDKKSDSSSADADATQPAAPLTAQPAFTQPVLPPPILPRFDRSKVKIIIQR